MIVMGDVRIKRTQNNNDNIYPTIYFRHLQCNEMVINNVIQALMRDRNKPLPEKQTYVHSITAAGRVSRDGCIN